jgi:hypothetical protein
LAGCTLVSLDGLSGSVSAQSVTTPDASSTDGPADPSGDSASADVASEEGNEGHPIHDAMASDAPEPADDGPAADTGGSNDAGSPGGGPDAGSKDAGAHDTGTTGGPDASPPLGFCAGLGSTPLFCDDFDEGTPLGVPPWDQITNTNGSETLSTASFVSSPDAMLVTVVPNASVSAIDVAGYKSFTTKQGIAGAASLAFAIRIDAGDTSSASDAILGAIQLWNGSAYYDLELEVFYVSATNDFQVSMSEYGSTGTYTEHMVTPHIPMATWTNVAIGITLPAAGDGSAPATLSLDGANAASITAHVTTSDPIPEILVGTTFATPTAGGWSIAYDNVTFEEP